jgi:hypothetical protein
LIVIRPAVYQQDDEPPHTRIRQIAIQGAAVVCPAVPGQSGQDTIAQDGYGDKTGLLQLTGVAGRQVAT